MSRSARLKTFFFTYRRELLTMYMTFKPFLSRLAGSYLTLMRFFLHHLFHYTGTVKLFGEYFITSYTFCNSWLPHIYEVRLVYEVLLSYATDNRAKWVHSYQGRCYSNGIRVHLRRRSTTPRQPHLLCYFPVAFLYG